MTEDDLIRVVAKWRMAGPPHRQYKMAVITCPFCDKKHEHGWGSSPKVPHCDGPPRWQEHFVVCNNDAEPAL